LIADQSDIVYNALLFRRMAAVFMSAREIRVGFRTRLLRMPVLGGVATELIANVDGPVTFSPDGHQLAFLRENGETRQTSMVIADPATAE